MGRERLAGRKPLATPGLARALPDLDIGAHHSDPRGCLGLTSTGSWSSGTYLPMGAAVNRRTGHTWVWQIEHNGGWHWQVGEHTGRDAASMHHAGPASTYLALLGPDRRRAPVAADAPAGRVVRNGSSGGGGERRGPGSGRGPSLTRYRRAIRRPHDDHRRLPVIFNDYMNTLMGDPTTERLVPLIDGGRPRSGAEYFASTPAGTPRPARAGGTRVGAWAPSRTHGSLMAFDEVLD